MGELALLMTLYHIGETRSGMEDIREAFSTFYVKERNDDHGLICVIAEILDNFLISRRVVLNSYPEVRHPSTPNKTTSQPSYREPSLPTPPSLPTLPSPSSNQLYSSMNYLLVSVRIQD